MILILSMRWKNMMAVRNVGLLEEKQKEKLRFFGVNINPLRLIMLEEVKWQIVRLITTQ